MFAATKQWAAAAALAMWTAAPVLALEQRPLPLFSVMTPAGEPVASAALSAEPRWLIVYVTDPCGTCAQLWTAMEQWQVDQLPGRLVVIVGGDRTRAADLAGTLPGALRSARVLADPDGSARQALRLTNALTIVGLDRGRVRWGLAGVLNEPTALRATLTTWVTQSAPPDAKP